MSDTDKSKHKAKPKSTAANNPKVFDVMRPGKAPASPTSRPVIVGHKTKVQDHMFAEPPKHAPLIEHAAKLGVEPPAVAAPSTESPAPAATVPVSVDEPSAMPLLPPAGQVVAQEEAIAPATAAEPTPPTPAPVPTPTPTPSPESFTPVPTTPSAQADLAASLAAVGLTTATSPEAPAESVDPPASLASEAPTLAPTPSLAPEQSLAPTTPSVADQIAVPSSKPIAPLPKEAFDAIKDDHTKPYPAGGVVNGVTVSHHRVRMSPVRILVVLAIVVLFAVLLLDLLLDQGVLTLNVPHTHLL